MDRPSAGRAFLARSAFLAFAAVGTGAGTVAALAGAEFVADASWFVVALVALVVSVSSVVRSLRRGRVGVDVVAVAALIGTVVAHELAAAAVVGLMLATGQLLEARASWRADRDLRVLLDRMPTVAHRWEAGELVDVPIDGLGAGDEVLVRPGEAVPVDGRLASPAVLDLSAITGEPLPERADANAFVRSGAVNAGDPFTLRAVSSASDSSYAAIVNLVAKASGSSAPVVRLADRCAVFFVPLAFALAFLSWLVSGTFDRAVAVLVVATPCPLLLAVPVAITSGLNRAARRGVLVKGGGALERLAVSETLVFDKTGTITTGRPEPMDVVVAPGEDPTRVLRLAASLEQASPHLLASAIVASATKEGLPLLWPESASELLGRGTVGVVDRSSVRVGRLDWLTDDRPPEWARRLRRHAASEGATAVFIEIDGALSGAVVLEDRLRPDATRTLRELRRCGFRKLIMASGDRGPVAEAIGSAVGADEVVTERSPAQKAALIELERREAVTVMVGDGVNDAAALAAADVGVAMGGRSPTAASEAADVVLLVDRIDRLADAVHIARRSHRIALQSASVGMALSAVAMVVAALGHLQPLAGALIQEGIDAIAIANALRALRPGRDRTVRLSAADAELGRRFQAEHIALAPGLRAVRALADDLGRIPAGEARDRLASTRTFLVQQLVPHEQAEDARLYPAVARTIGGTDPTATMSRMHVEIIHHVEMLDRLLAELPPSGPTDEDVVELRRVLYGLDALLRLHNAQEEQEYLSLGDSDGGGGPGRNEPPLGAGAKQAGGS